MGMVTSKLQIVKDLDFAKSFDPHDFSIDMEIRHSHHRVTFDKDDHTYSHDRLREFFSEYLFESEFEYLDYERTFTERGLDYNNYAFDEYVNAVGEDDVDQITFMVLDGTGDTISIPFHEIQLKTEKVECLLFKIVHEHKGGYYEEPFWKWSKLDDFDGPNETRNKNAKVFLLTQLDLDEAKQYYKENYPIHDWDFTDLDHVVHLNW